MGQELQRLNDILHILKILSQDIEGMNLAHSSAIHRRVELTVNEVHKIVLNLGKEMDDWADKEETKLKEQNDR